MQKLKEDLRTIRSELLTGLGFSALALVWLELWLHICLFEGIYGKIIFPMLFGCALGLLTGTLCRLLPPIPGRITAGVLLGAETILAGVQLIYHEVFGSLMQLSLVGMGGAVFQNFGDEILYAMSRVPLQLLGLLLPLLVMGILLLLKKAPGSRLRLRIGLVGMYGTVLCLALAFCLAVLTHGGEASVWQLLTSRSTQTDISYENAGMVATTIHELAARMDPSTDLSLSGSVIDTCDAGTVWDSDLYNVLELDFTALAKSTEDQTLKQLDAYFATRVPTAKNVYTGMLEGYNLITICAESFSPYLIDETLTPALYRLSNQGILFENYYGCFQSVTSNGEYTMCTGLFPDMLCTRSATSFEASVGNYLPFCLGNALGSMGYSTWAYHGNMGEYYSRNLTHPNMGYTFKSGDDGLNLHMTRPGSDLELMEQSVADYLADYTADGTPFHAYYMSWSGHYQYNWDNAMSEKNRAVVENTELSETVQAYIACSLELEYALEYLLEALEEAGAADRTVIVLTNDHYPYGLDEVQYNELAGTEVDTTFEIYRNSLICYIPDMEESIHVSSYCSTEDILPTLLNLFGVEYDSRLLAGRDILADCTHVAVLADQSFVTADFRRNSADGRVEPADTVDRYGYSADDYVAEIADRFTVSAAILNSDYYAHAFGQEKQEETAQETTGFSDITESAHKAVVQYVVREGLMDPDSDEVFGGDRAATAGELCSALYRIAGSPTGDFSQAEETICSSGSAFYAAVCWAWDSGILREADGITADATVDHIQAAVLLLRYAELCGTVPEADPEKMAALLAEYPELDEEQAQAVIWSSDESVINKDRSYFMENEGVPLTRFQLAAYISFLCTHILGDI